MSSPPSKRPGPKGGVRRIRTPLFVASVAFLLASTLTFLYFVITSLHETSEFIRNNLGNIFSSFIGGMIQVFFVSAIGYVAFKLTPEKMKEVARRQLQSLLREHDSHPLEYETALSNISRAVSAVMKVVIRVENFNQSGDSAYDETIKSVLGRKDVWDYHVHLAGPTDKSRKFLEPFCEIDAKSKGVTVRKNIFAAQLVVIPRTSYSSQFTERTYKYSLDAHALSTIVIATFKDPGDFRALHELSSSSLDIKNILLFYADDVVFELDPSIRQDVAERILEIIKGLANTDSALIFDDGKSGHDNNAAARRLYASIARSR